MYHDTLIIAIPFFLVLFEFGLNVLYKPSLLLILVRELCCMLSSDIPDGR